MFLGFGIPDEKQFLSVLRGKLIWLSDWVAGRYHHSHCSIPTLLM